MENSTPTVSFSLTFKRAAEALEFYKRALGAEETFRMDGPEGTLPHGEFKIGNTEIFLSDEAEEWGAFAMPEGQTSPCLFSIETDDCDASFRKAIDAGATELSPPTDQFWGMRSCVIRDPFGYRWSFNQVLEQLSREEIARRAQEMMSS